jgi:hypothetical protein
MIDLGCITFVQPPEYKAHLEAEKKDGPHDITYAKAGRCITNFVCHTCELKWWTDTGD